MTESRPASTARRAARRRSDSPSTSRKSLFAPPIRDDDPAARINPATPPFTRRGYWLREPVFGERLDRARVRDRAIAAPVEDETCSLRPAEALRPGGDVAVLVSGQGVDSGRGRG